MASVHPTKQRDLFENVPQEKPCSKCGKIKPLDAFYGNRRNNCGRCSECKECSRATAIRTKERGRVRICTATERECRRCVVMQPIDNFSRQPSCKDGRRPDCKSCCSAYNCRRAKQKKSDPEHRKKLSERDRIQGLRRYGVTVKEYEAMHAVQNGLCAICGKAEITRCNRSNKKRMLCVDHDHSTGAIRSLLCAKCNHGLGNFHDDVSLLKAAIDYLERHRMVS